MQKVVCFGPGPKFKGGISNYNTSLAKAFDSLGVETHIVSWTQQYPAIIPREFVDKSSATDFIEGSNIQVHYSLNYNNPISWNRTVSLIAKLNPDLVIIQWAIAIQGIPISFLAKELSKSLGIRVIFDLHFVIQKEASSVDQRLTKQALQYANEYVTHSHKTTKELQDLFPKQLFRLNNEDENNGGKRVFELYHPVYSLFEPLPDFNVDEFKLKYGLKQNVFLFFGFIRKYKGLHYALEAFKKVEEQRDDVSLLVCGESFWNTLDDSKWTTRIRKKTFNFLKSILLSSKENEDEYQPLDLIETLQIENVAVFNEFIPNEDVPKYFQASDSVLLFYEYATPSGIESLAYNFSKPILATAVGHFPETIIDGLNGYLAKPGDINSMANIMIQSIEQPIDPENIKEIAKEKSWKNYAETILNG